MPERIPEHQMPGLLRQPFPNIPLGVWRHTKSGKPYVVVGGTFLATGEDQVVNVHYISPEHGYSAHRTQEDFLAEIAIPVMSTFAPMSRFTCVQPMDGVEVAAFLLRVLVANLGNTLWRFITRPISIGSGAAVPSVSPGDEIGAPPAA